MQNRHWRIALFDNCHELFYRFHRQFIHLYELFYTFHRQVLLKTMYTVKAVKPFWTRLLAAKAYGPCPSAPPPPVSPVLSTRRPQVPFWHDNALRQIPQHATDHRDSANYVNHHPRIGLIPAQCWPGARPSSATPAQNRTNIGPLQPCLWYCFTHSNIKQIKYYHCYNMTLTGLAVRHVCAHIG